MRSELIPHNDPRAGIPAQKGVVVSRGPKLLGLLVPAHRLAEFVDSGKSRGRRLALLGFSDSRGTSARNATLARERAEQIAKALRQRDVNPEIVTGYGAAAPVACNSSDEGLEKNRRVEVWLF